MLEENAIEGVILAAGMSSRAGGFKPGLAIGGKPMLARCIEGMSNVCGRIIVVGGHEVERLRSLVANLHGVVCVENPSYRKGMFTSVKAGLAMVRADRCFVLPVDIPLVPASVYRTLLAIDADIVVPAYRGRNGHPVCLSKTVLPRILSEPDDSSLREAIRALGVCTVDVDAEEILMDVDTPQDYEAICRRILG
jgi:molybdenum cofactor cytidylyltransferase